MDERAIPLGQTIKKKRKAARLTQQELADRAGLSVVLIRKLEQGLRHTASIGSIQQIARALDVTVAELLGQAQALPGDDPNSGVVAIRRVLTSVDDLIDDVAEIEEPISLRGTTRDVTYAWGAYWGGKYEELTALLAQAMVRARAVEHGSTTKERAAAVDQLAQLYQLASCTLVHLGHPDTAWLAWERASGTANRGNDPLRVAALRGSLSWLLLTQGRYKDSRKVALKTAEAIDTGGKASLPQLSIYGNLMISAATAAGRDIKLQARSEKASDYLAEARGIAERTGERNDYESPFGREQVIMQTTDVQVVTERYSEALRTAKQMPRDAGLPLAARSRHLADVAFSQAQLGQDDQASNTVLTIAAAAPHWIKHQTLYRQTVAQLDARQPPTKLHELAVSIGATPDEM